MFFLWLGLFVLTIAGAVIFSVPEFGLVALGTITAIVISLIPGLENAYLIQLTSVLFSFFLLFVFLRKKVKSVFQGNELREDPFEISGRIGVVVEPIEPNSPGRISLGGTTWTAISYSESFRAGERVQVLEKEGLTLVVNKIDQEVAWK